MKILPKILQVENTMLMLMKRFMMWTLTMKPQKLTTMIWQS
jgi:hypothetical protein